MLHKRKTLTLTLNNGNDYDFSERNIEDRQEYLFDIQEDLRKKKIVTIQETITDPDDRLALLSGELRRDYSQGEIYYYQISREYKLKMLFDSFKVLNDCKFSDFIPLVEGKYNEFLALLFELEKEPESKKKMTGKQ
jgi:hypothetical protein